MEDICKYPIVFVHGLFGWGADEGINNKMPYWGATTGDLTQYLQTQGYEAYSASVGPISSSWDRACELYARLTGGVVDYGKAHSARTNHRRFGRTYDKALIPDWGKDKKVHLIGHSFGGNTIRLLAHLLTYGDAEEQQAGGNVSELFTGGKQDWVQSIVTICAPHNGAIAFEAARRFAILPVIKVFAYNYAGLMGRTPAEGRFVDFHLEQYGMSDTPGQKDAFPLYRAKKQYMHNADNTEYDLSYKGAAELNARIEICPDVYYFSYAYNAVSQSASGKYNVVSETSFPPLHLTSSIILAYNRVDKHGDEQGCRNDGLVQVESALHPVDEPFQPYDKDHVLPGIWNVMPVRVGDHGTPIGLFTPAAETHAFYLNILRMLRETEKAAVHQ